MKIKTKRQLKKENINLRWIWLLDSWRDQTWRSVREQSRETSTQKKVQLTKNRQIHPDCHQSNRCRADWSPGGCYCLCPPRPQSSGCYLWTLSCCHWRCRCCSCCCRRRGSPSPERSQLQGNTGDSFSMQQLLSETLLQSFTLKKHFYYCQQNPWRD